MADFYALLTDVGLAEIANAAATGKQIDLTHMSVGDGNGNPVIPEQNQTKLVNEKYKATLNYLGIDANNENYLVAEFLVPASVGGFTVRETGLWNSTGQLIAVGNTPDTYKPVLSEGASKELTVRMVIEVSNADSVNLVLDPTVVLASRKWVLETIDKECVQLNQWEFGSFPKFDGDLNSINENRDYWVQPSLESTQNAPSVNSGHLITRFISPNFGYQWFIERDRRWFRHYSYAWGEWKRNYVDTELVFKGQHDFGPLPRFVGDLNTVVENRDYWAYPNGGATNTPSGNSGHLISRFISSEYGYQWYIDKNLRWYRYYTLNGWSEWARNYVDTELVFKGELDFGRPHQFTGDLNSLLGENRDRFVTPSGGATNAPTTSAGYLQTRSISGIDSHQYYYRGSQVWFRSNQNNAGWTPWVRQSTGLTELSYGEDGAVPLNGGLVMQWGAGSKITVSPKSTTKIAIFLPFAFSEVPFSVIPSIKGENTGHFLFATWDHASTTNQTVFIDVHNPADDLAHGGTPIVQVIGKMY